MATIKACDIDLATVERLKRRVVCAERSGDRAGSLHVPSEPTDTAGASNPSPSSNPREDPADELVIQLDVESLRAFLNVMEARILADRSSPDRRGGRSPRAGAPDPRGPRRTRARRQRRDPARGPPAMSTVAVPDLVVDACLVVKWYIPDGAKAVDPGDSIKEEELAGDPAVDRSRIGGLGCRCRTEPLLQTRNSTEEEETPRRGLSAADS